MNLEYVNVVSAGDLANERLVMKASVDLDVGLYLILLGANVGNDKIKSEAQQISFWFPDKKIKSNDLVILYTKIGKTSEKTLDSGATARFYYWNLSEPIWVAGHTPVIIEVKTWGFGQRFE